MRRSTTAQPVRPPTVRPQTAASVRPEGTHVIAVTEGRGISHEVGIATLDQETGKVTMVQASGFVLQ
jgi:DNA mismatch repair protein MSH4